MSDASECDGCMMRCHIQCDTGVREGDVSARMTSNNLRLFCSDCAKRKLDMLNCEKLSIIYKYIEEIDLKTQNHVVIQTEMR